MLSKAQISLISSLQQKKFRVQNQRFIVEGIKSVLEFISSAYTVREIFFTADNSTKLVKIPHNIKLHELSPAEFQKITALKHPQGVLALVEIPKAMTIDPTSLRNKFTLVGGWRHCTTNN